MESGPAVRKPILILLLFLVGVAGLVVLFHVIDIRRAIEQISRIGYLGSALFIVNVGVTFLAPAAGWHLLMRAEGIPIRLRQTLTSGLMGHAFNLITPMMYLGGEPIRTFHVAHICGVSKRRVLATIIVNKFQEIAGLALFIVGGTAIMIATSSSLTGPQVAASVIVGIVLLGFLGAVLGMIIGKVQPTVKLFDFLIRRRIFPEKLERLREKAVETEVMVHETFVRRWRVFLLSQLLTLLSPLAQFLRPVLFYGFLKLAGDTLPMPTIAELATLFVLSQILFILPSTPGGLGIYEGGLVVIFTQVLRWSDADGGAFAILIRAADLLYIVFGVWLVVHYGMTSMLRSVVGAPPSPSISLETRTDSTDESSAPGDPDGNNAPRAPRGDGPQP
jgi:uncharacterized protein (TIRG00374 family)